MALKLGILWPKRRRFSNFNQYLDKRIIQRLIVGLFCSFKTSNNFFKRFKFLVCNEFSVPPKENIFFGKLIFNISIIKLCLIIIWEKRVQGLEMMQESKDWILLSNNPYDGPPSSFLLSIHLARTRFFSMWMAREVRPSPLGLGALVLSVWYLWK